MCEVYTWQIKKKHAEKNKDKNVESHIPRCEEGGNSSAYNIYATDDFEILCSSNPLLETTVEVT